MRRTYANLHSGEGDFEFPAHGVARQRCTIFCDVAGAAGDVTTHTTPERARKAELAAVGKAKLTLGKVQRSLCYSIGIHNRRSHLPASFALIVKCRNYDLRHAARSYSLR